MTPRTVAGLLRTRAESSRGGDVAIRFAEGEGWVEWSWYEYWQAARQMRMGLLNAGVRRGDHVLVAIPHVRPGTAALFGLWALGAVPIQIAPPLQLRNARGYFDELSAAAERLDARFLIVSTDLAQAAAGLRVRVLTVDDLLVDPDIDPDVDPHEAAGDEPDAPDDTAFLQLTSGSTSAPRAVIVTHGRLMMHLESMSRALPSGGEPNAVSWLPLHHDMGLVGGLLFPFFNGFPAHMIGTDDFRRRPSIWLETMSRFRGTITAAPPSAYALSVPLAPRLVQEGLDLSTWECAMVGAEPISAALLRRFGAAFTPAGFRPNAFFPVYGLAEATVAVTFPGLLAPASIDRVDAVLLQRDGVAVQSARQDSLEFVGVGRAIPDTEIRLVDLSGRVVCERAVGEIEVRSKSAALGYYGDPGATALTWRDGWLRTGDLGYIADGFLFVTGRQKELIVKGGHNLIPSVLEEIVARVEGVRGGGVAAVGLWSEQLQTELLCVVAETASGPEQHTELSARIRTALQTRGVSADRIVLLPPRSIPRTTSGKLQRVRLARVLSTGSNAVAQLSATAG
jgi:fatty-acyl-CoA synthase